MATLNDSFDRLLSNIEPDKKAIGYARNAHEPVREFLEADEDFGEYVKSTFLYGSYRRHTAVGDIKDVDIVVVTDFDSKKDAPREVLKKLKDALARYYEDPEKPDYQRRSIRINDPLPDNEDAKMTLDIIPAIETDGEDKPLLVPDRKVGKWIESHPKGHIEHTAELNDEDHSKGQFVPLVKMMKWWWKYQCQTNQPKTKRPKPKGFWIECLTAENFDLDQELWADHFMAILKSISAKYKKDSGVPKLMDPGLPDEVIRTSMTQKEFNSFLGTVNESLELAWEAYDKEDEEESSRLWRDIFGDPFPVKESEQDKAKERISVVLADTSHAKPISWPEDLCCTVRIDGYTHFGTDDTTKESRLRLGGLNSDSRAIQSGLWLKYVAKTKTPDPYSIFWQVVNTGEHARLNNDLRGTIFLGKHTHWERSKYTGKHWIECFIVKDNVCVARARFYVNIFNPAHPRT